MITRDLQKVIEERCHKGKAIILIGARQVGKSTLFSEICNGIEGNVLSLNCDDPETRAMLTNANQSELKLLIGNNKTVIIDEAQRVAGIGTTLKIITDNYKDVQLLVTGSSSFELHNRLEETLTGRKYEYHLYPVSTSELLKTGGLLMVRQTLEQRLIYGSYPEIVSYPNNAKELLMGIAESYLYKDILAREGIRKPALLEKLLVALALQVGSEVSYNEIGQTIGSDSKTVEKYIDLLEKCFIIFRISALSRNIRTELKKSRKVFFYDNGIRNAVLQNYAPLPLRNDAGALWENFVISERIKKNHYEGRYPKYYFWRTTSQQEIDFIEEEDGMFNAFEMKWNPKRGKASLPESFVKNYNVGSTNVVTPENYIEVLGSDTEHT
ncbi:MAG: ATP-binding protein [Muribaculaceae bacterium]